MLGFLKWLWGEYKNYKAKEETAPTSEEMERKEFLYRYEQCINAGLTKEQIYSLKYLFLFYAKNKRWWSNGDK